MIHTVINIHLMTGGSLLPEALKRAKMGCKKCPECILLLHALARVEEAVCTSAMPCDTHYLKAVTLVHQL